MDEQYYDIERRTAVKESTPELRRKFLRYRDAEVVYSMTHKKLLELAGKAGAIYRIDGYVLLDRDIFDEDVMRAAMMLQSMPEELRRVAVEQVKVLNGLGR